MNNWLCIAAITVFLGFVILAYGNVKSKPKKKESPVFCKNCKWCVNINRNLYFCRNPKLASLDLVSGEETNPSVYCQYTRKSLCQGNWYEKGLSAIDKPV